MDNEDKKKAGAPSGERGAADKPPAEGASRDAGNAESGGAGDGGASRSAGGDGESPKRRSRGRRGGRRRRSTSRQKATAEKAQESGGASAAPKEGAAPASAGGRAASEGEKRASGAKKRPPGDEEAATRSSGRAAAKKGDESPEGEAKKTSRRPRRRRRRKPAPDAERGAAAVAGGLPLVGTGGSTAAPDGAPGTADADAEPSGRAAGERPESAGRPVGKADADEADATAEGPVGQAGPKEAAKKGPAREQAARKEPAGEEAAKQEPAHEGAGRKADRGGAASSQKRKSRSRAPKPAPSDDAGRAGDGDGKGKEEKERSGPAEAPRPRRRSRTATRPAGPAAERVVLASEDLGELRVAVVEDDRLAAVYLERAERPSILGNIYRARVQNVLKGMDASFVDFGFEKAGFLHVDEVTSPDDNGPRRSRRITQLLKAGQELTVQVTKDPMKGKGARLSTKISLPGRYLVYVPDGSGVGVSRRLPQEERDRLRDLCKKLRPRSAGLIVRTVAEGKELEDLRRDLQYLSRLWSRVKKKAEKTSAPALVHQEVDVALSAARDLVDETCTKFVIDAPKVRKRVVSYLERVAPELAGLVEGYDGDRPLFEEYGVEDAIDGTLSRRAPLPSGGNLVIDPTEALTVVDVNSGKYTGGKRLEDTITRTNLEAAEELVRQLRLRDIGGIIVIDFIDMARRENREAVLAKLEESLSRDKTKTYVVEISPLGLVEMTRQGTTEGTRALMTVTCPTCHGTSRVLSPDTMARDAERVLDRQLPGTAGEAVLVEVQRAVADRLTESERAERLERRHGKRLVFDGSQELPVDTLRIVASGTVQEIEAQRLPVREGEELEVELRHSLPYSPRDAVAVVDGYQLVVKGGRQHLGRTRRVKVESVQRAGGWATLV